MEGWREGGREGIILCDGNYGRGEYGMEWVHRPIEEPERKRASS